MLCDRLLLIQNKQRTPHQSEAAEGQAKLDAKEAECSDMAAVWEGKMATVQTKHEHELRETIQALEQETQARAAELEHQWKTQIEVRPSKRVYPKP